MDSYFFPLITQSDFYQPIASSRAGQLCNSSIQVLYHQPVEKTMALQYLNDGWKPCGHHH